MDIIETIEIAAPPERVWAVMADVERWSEWTASIRRVEVLDGGPLRLGGRARVQQPRLPNAVWTVSVWDPPRCFEWRNASPGVRSVAGHRVEALADDRSRVTLSIAWSGPLAWLVRLLFGRLSRRYVAMEARGLVGRCERPRGGAADAASSRACAP